MEEWKEYKLEEICTKITDGSHFSPQACQTGYPMFSVKDMLEYGFDYSNCKYISKKDFKSMKSGDCVPQKGDILVAKDGSFLKQIFECKETKEEAILSSIAIFRPNQNIITPTFLCYLLKSPKVYNYIALNCVSGSALPRIVLKDFKKVTMQVPPLPTQQKIVAILSSLDDKIELNNKINTNLEQQAQALFKNWFVDFEPFGGKMPEGWKVGKLSDITEITNGKRPPMKQSDYSKDVSIPLVGAASVMGYTNQVLYNEPILITGRVGTHGVIQRFSTKCWPSDNTLVVKSQYYEYVYQIMCNIDYDNMNRGSTQPLITQSDLGKVECIIPDEGNLNKFEQLTNNLFAKVQENQLENQKLANIRDTLLPKLMNGEINIE